MLNCHPYRDNATTTPTLGRVVTYSFKQSRTVQAALFTMCPKDWVDPHCIRGRNPHDPDVVATIREVGFLHGIFKTRNGATCEVTTAGQGTLAHASDTLDYVWCDEPPKPTHYSELLARLLATNGDLYLTYTPIGRPVEWLKKECEEGRVEDHHFALTTEDCPFYNQAQIDDISASYLPAEWRQRVLGEWDGITTGRVFTGFHETKSVFDDPPDVDLDIYLGFDHGENAGTEVILLLGVDRKTGTVYVLGEYVSDGATTPDQDALGVAMMLAGWGLSLLDVIHGRGDCNSAGKLGSGIKLNTVFERSFADLAQVQQTPFPIWIPEKGRNSIVSGCRLVNFGLLNRKLLIHTSCLRLLKTLRHWTGKNDDLKHASDALRYIAVDFFRDTSYMADRLVING
jgi:phage terminase large subunit-like protein